MSISLRQNSLISSLLPESVLTGLQVGEGKEKLGEAQMSAVSILIVNTVLGAIKVVKAGNYKALDANPADGGCQCRALELGRLMKLDLREEVQALEKVAAEVKSVVNKRKGSPKEQAKCSAQQFFQTHVAPLNVSKEMEYILHCYLSTVMRTPYQILETGVVMTRSELSKLGILSEKIALVETEQKRKILEGNQKVLSRLSVEAMRRSAEQLTLMNSDEKGLTIKMLSAEQTHIFSHSPQYEPKTYGILFYEIKTLLFHLRQEREIVCVKSIVKESGSYLLFLQSAASGSEFELLSEKDVLQTSCLTVFEAVLSVDKERAIELLKEESFTNLILMQSALQPPYEPSSRLEDVKVPEARAEIQVYREKTSQMKSVFTLDHIYFTTLAAEQKLGVGKI